MSHTLLISLGIAAVGLLLLYMLARRFPLFGDSLAFLCILLAHLFVKMQWMLEKAGNYGYKVFEKSLHYPPRVNDDSWRGLAVIKRLVDLFLACCVLFGEAYNTLLAVPALLQVPNDVTLPGGLSLASSMLFLSCPAIFGDVALECAGIIPETAGLFPPLEAQTKKRLCRLCLVGVALSMLTLLLFWIYRGWYLVDPDSAQLLGIGILGLLGICVGGAAVLAFWALAVGLIGLASCLSWLAAALCRGIAASLSLVPAILDVLAVHLSDGRIGVYHELLPGDPYKAAGPLFRGYGKTTVQEAATKALPAPSATIDTNVFPVTKGEETMSHPDKNASVNFFGSYSTKMFTPVSQKITTLRATESILTSVYLDLSVTHIQTAIPGVVDLSPPHTERKATLLHSETEGQAYNTLLNQLADKLVETHLDTKASPAPLIFVIDCRALVDAVDMLESIKRRLPLHSLLVVTSLSAMDVRHKTVQTGLADMQSLHAEDVIETVMVTDPHYSFALAYGEETQHHFLAQTLVSLVTAHKHSLLNRSFTSILHELHSISPFTGVSFASEVVATGSIPKRWAWLPGVKNQAGTGNYGDILSQTRSAIDRVVTDENTRTFPASVSMDAASTILSCVPLELNDPRHADSVLDNARYVASHYSPASSITVRGNGCAYPHHIGGRFLVQASCLYPLQPASLLRLQEGKQVTVTPLHPLAPTRERASGNGHVPVQENNGEPKITKAVTTKGQKQPATPSRRMARKSTKAAQ